MPATQSIKDTSGRDAVSSASGSGLRLRCYLAPFLVVPILIIIAAIPIVPSEWFAMHSRDPYIVTLGYGAQLRNTECQILIYGDSTAMVGLNPAIIRQRTGLSTCNIAETEGMTMVNGTMVVDLFLQHNPRPRFLIFMYAPEALNPPSQRKNPVVKTFEAVTFRFRQPDKLRNFFVLMKHPEDIFGWSEHGLRLAGTAALSTPLPEQTKLLRINTMGQLPRGEPGACTCNYSRHNNPPDKAWVQNLRSKYSQYGTVVMIDSVLLPDCDPDVDYFRQELAGVIDNRINTLPATDFYGGGRHVNNVGSVLLSDMVADQVLDRLHVQADTGGG